MKPQKGWFKPALLSRRIIFPALGFLLPLVPTGCGSRVVAPGSGGESAVVARFGDSVVTVDDVDARILSLPQTQRPKPGQDLDDWYVEEIGQIVVEASLRDAGAAESIDQSEAFLAVQRHAEQQFAVQLCLAQASSDIETIGDQELHEFYQSRKQTFAAPERRAAYHIFHRGVAGESQSEARAAMEGIRDHVLRGEGFQRLAKEHSDSESRHREGSLGWLTRGQLPGGFDDVIFGLEEGVPSEIVETRDGLHIFYVDQILPARQLSFDEARSIVRKQYLAGRSQATLVELEAAAVLRPEDLILDRKEFEAISAAGDQDAVVLRIDDSELTLGEIHRQLREMLTQQDSVSPVPAGELAWRLVEQRRRRELVYRHCMESGSIPADDLEASVATWKARAVVDFYRNRKLHEIALRDESRLQMYYESNIGLFSKPPKWRIRRLRIPLDDNAGTVMARLEKAAAQPGSTLETLKAELGGEILTMEFSSQADLRRMQPKLPPLIAPLAEGELSPPFRSDGGLEIAEVVERQEAEPLPFSTVRERVAATYVQQYTSELYQELCNEILQTHPLEIVPGGLAALRASGSMRPDISVEQLEALLDEL